jgi:hypothetical protein
MVNGAASAAKAVDRAVLLKKAQAWRYEREWRLIGDRGLQNSPLELEEVVFGMRCPSTIRFTVAMALSTRTRPVKFYEIREKPGTFLLERVVADLDELLMCWPRRARDTQDAFKSLLANDPEAL